MASMAIAFANAVGIGGGIAAGAGVSAIGAASTFATVLQGVMTAGSVLAQIGAGRAQAREASLQATLAQLDGDREVLASRERELEIRRDALKRIGQARVAFAGSGLDISSGQLRAIEGAVEDDSQYQIGIEKNNRELARSSSNLKALRYRMAANNAMTGAYAGAFSTGLSGLLKIARRG